MKAPKLRVSKQDSLPRLVMIVLIIVGALALATILMVRRVYHQNLQPASPSQHSQVITVPLGSSPHEIATLLKKEGLIRSDWAFEWYVRSREVGDQLKAGSYELRPSQSVADIVTILTEGRIATNLITILPAQRLDQIKSAFMNAGFDKTEVERALDPDLYANHPALVDKPPGASLEGYLYPESFQKTDTTKPETIIRKSLDEMQKRLTPSVRTAITKHGLSVHEGVILASIVEEEVSTPDDRAKVAQVFYSRLAKGMPLQSDPTAYYAAAIAGVARSLSIDSPYNTYLHGGLPPGPISNVSQTSLAAVANPATTDWLYFVAGDDGTTHYSHTVSEHEAQVKQYCTKLCSGH